MVKRSPLMVRLAKYALLIVIFAVMTFPLLWMLRVSLLDTGSTLGPSGLISASATLSNYLDLFLKGNLGRYLFNSIFVGLTVTVGNIFFCFAVAYTLARHRYILNKLLFGTVVAVLMIPAHIVIIPLYVMMVRAGLYDSYGALILPWLVNPIGIFLVKQYLESVPTSMEEAARIDGAGELRIMFQVVMPLCKPALAVLAIQVFFTNWNSFLFPFILTSSEHLRTLPVGLALLQGHQAIDWQHLMAGSSIAVIPILILFLFMQRQIVSGITSGAIKQ
jgi:multiple sugar transport system permease protein